MLATNDPVAAVPGRLSLRRPLAAALIGLIPALALVQRADAQPFTWRNLAFPASSTFVFDFARERLLAIAPGASQPHLEWNGNDWVALPAAAAVPGAAGRAVFDMAKQRVLFLAGATANETWEFDGRSWTQLLPPVSPPVWSPMASALVWHAARNAVVWLGTSSTTGELEAWEWTGATWRLVTASAYFPYPNSTVTAAYDAARQLVVITALTAGRNTATLEWSSSTWRFVSGQTALAPLLAFDVARNRVVCADTSAAALYEWDGSAWNRTVAAPAGLTALAEMGTRGIAAFGQALHYLRNNQWTTIDALPSNRVAHAIAYDPFFGNVMLFGGLLTAFPNDLALNDTWFFDGQRWTRVDSVAMPPARHSHALTAIGGGGFVLSGGMTSSTPPTYLNDAWVWSGGRWQQATGAPARASHATAAGPTGAVMFGGSNGTLVLNDTFVLTSNLMSWSWQLRSPTTRPSARVYHRLAFDSARGRTVLFGGRNQAFAMLNDTWEWDGSNWLLMSPPQSPPANFLHGMYYDSARQRVVLLGTDAWEWDGAGWTQIATTTPFSLPYLEAAYDSTYRRAVVVPPRENPPPPGVAGPFVAVWTFAAGPAAATATYGAGCGGTRGVPALAAVGDPYLGHRGFGFDLLQARGSSPAVALLARARASLSFGGGCTVLVDPAQLLVAVPLATNSAGFASLPLAIPVAPPLIGATLHAQALVADPAGPALGLSATQGLTAVVGR